MKLGNRVILIEAKNLARVACKAVRSVQSRKTMGIC